MSSLIPNVQAFIQGHLQPATVVIDGDRIADILPATGPCHQLLLPGVIDAHVHFREPGLTHKADIASESRAAAAGGVTYVLDMPNVLPTTTTPQALADKHRLFRQHCLVNYGLWYGITADNIPQAIADYGLPTSPYRQDICGFKVFLGSSTGGMLMNDQQLLRQLFASTQRVIGIHSESEDIIRRNAQRFRTLLQSDDLPIEYHPRVRDVEACMHTTRMAVELALQTGAQLHVCHLTTSEELNYLSSVADPDHCITAEACISHLWFSQDDYRRLGTRIKCNPAIKRVQDRDALRNALADGRIFSIATDHAPHLMTDKQGGALRAASGMPSIQFSLLAVLQLCSQGVLPLQRVVELMSLHPAQRFGLEDRGSIHVGAYADLVLVDPHTPTVVTPQSILSKCGWSPFSGTTFTHSIVTTWCNGQPVYQR